MVSVCFNICTACRLTVMCISGQAIGIQTAFTEVSVLKLGCHSNRDGDYKSH